MSIAVLQCKRRNKIRLMMMKSPNLNAIARSERSLREIYLQFINSTTRDLYVFWIDYKGEEKFYALLKPQDRTNVNTYQTHPWVFRDSCTGEYMQVQHEYILWPKLFVVPNPRNPAEMAVCRKQFAIHFPVRSLRENSMWAIIREPKMTNERVDSLCIPQMLKAELKLLMVDRFYHAEEIINCR